MHLAPRFILALINDVHGSIYQDDIWRKSENSSEYLMHSKVLSPGVTHTANSAKISNTD